MNVICNDKAVRKKVERHDREIEDIKKQLHIGIQPTAESAFFVHTETELTSFGAERRFTGFVAGYPLMTGLQIVPITDMVFVRITNLLPVRTMINRLTVSLDGCPVTDRIDGRTSSVYFIPSRGSRFVPAVGRELEMENNGTGTYGMLGNFDDADRKNGAEVILPLLDRELSDHYLEPSETLGGWILFASRCAVGDFRFELEDVAGRKFVYRIPHSNEMKSGDVSRHPIRIGNPTDLSNAAIDDFWCTRADYLGRPAVCGITR